MTGSLTSDAMAARDLEAIVELALAEDVGAGDWTTLWTVPDDRRVEARLLAKERGVIAGTAAARLVFARVDPTVEVHFEVEDGDRVESGSTVARLSGSARSILTAERVALNFLQHLSGVATVTRAFVDAVGGTSMRILDSRKTTPGMRRLEKAAVRAGGGHNHRVGLYDMVLIKENHIRAAGGITRAMEAVERQNDQRLEVEVETTSLDEVREAAEAGATRILLDNMTPPMLAEAVALLARIAPEVDTEASGGITLANVGDIARTGVDYASVGALTHSAPALDLSLLVELGDTSG